MVSRSDRPVFCDLAVFWGFRRRDVMKAQRLAGGRYLVLERGYMGDRKHWTSAGYDGLNGRADFCNTGATADRLHAHFPPLRPWRTGGQHVLVIGQCRADQSVRRLHMEAQLAAAVIILRNRGGLAVRFRPHPRDPEMPAPAGASVIEGTLQDALDGSRVVVTLNSNCGVDAALAGVPVIALDQGSMAWPVAGHKAQDAITPPRPDRERWAAELAWCQWTDREFEAGDAWDHLRKGMQRRRFS